MPRLPRRTEPGVVYHLISRFVDREWFITSEKERKTYVRLLGRALLKSDWRCFAYAIMSNHIHLGAVAGKQPLARWIRRVHSPFADSMNRTHDRIGVMFVRGPKAFAVPPERVGRLISYIHNNPVRAGVAATARASRWTSHRAYLGLDPTPKWLHVEEGLARGGFADAKTFDAWVSSASPANSNDEWLDPDVESEPATSNRVAQPPDPRRIVEATAAELEVPMTQFCSRRRGTPERTAREVAVHCAMRFGIDGVTIANALNISQQGVSVISRREQRPEIVELCTRVLKRVA